MQPIRKKLLPLVLFSLSLITVPACKSSTPPANAPATSTPSAGAAASSAPAASPTTTTASGSQGVANCGDCWVHLYDDKNFKETDDHLLLCGPGKWPNLRNLPTAVKPEWGDEIESMKVGPTATVVVWTGENYTGTTQTFGPGKEIPNFLGSPLIKNAISSIEIRCQ